MTPLSGFETYLFVALGVVLSILIPLLRPLIPISFGPRADPAEWWPYARPFLIIGVFSLLVAVLIVAFSKETIDDKWGLAVLAGYAWDSTLQKLSKG